MGLHNKHFYTQTIRKYVVGFGNIFNNVYILRFNKDGEEVQREKVPMAYGPKEKYIYRLEQNDDLVEKYSIKLPRISYEMIKVRYDPSRATPPNNKLRNPRNGSVDGNLWAFNAVPYQFVFKVYIMGKTSDECLQIVEQIVPFFTPDFTMTIKSHEELEQKLDIPVTLDSIDLNDTWDGEFTDRRHIIWELDFTLSGFLYPPVRTAPLILQSEWNIGGYDAYASGANPTFEDSGIEILAGQVIYNIFNFQTDFETIGV
jgi:hypothetical protein